MTETLQALLNISKAVATAPFLTQGGGGNTSVKNNGVMTIKASGFRLDEMSVDSGHVTVKTANINQFLSEPVPEGNPDTQIKEIAMQSIEGNSSFLPSMETGFHAVLKPYVIHTHPIAVNALLCCNKAQDLLRIALPDIPFLFLEYLNPGYFLSKAIADYPSPPDVIFLKNHGLIVHANTEANTIALHTTVIGKIVKYTGITTPISFELIPIESQLFELKTEALALFFNRPELLQTTLFPDQAVVIGNHFSFSTDETLTPGLNFNTNSQRCFISAAYKNATAMAENLIALYHIILYAQHNKLQIEALPIENVAYILGMDMEKYRQEILKKH